MNIFATKRRKGSDLTSNSSEGVWNYTKETAKAIAKIGILGGATVVVGINGLNALDVMIFISDNAKGNPYVGYTASKAVIDSIDEDVGKGRERITVPGTTILPRLTAEYYLKGYLRGVGNTEKADAYAREHPIKVRLEVPVGL